MIGKTYGLRPKIVDGCFSLHKYVDINFALIFKYDNGAFAFCIVM